MTHAVVGMFGVRALGASLVLATSAEGEVGTYVALFLLEVVGWMGVPVVGTAALTAAAVLASQGVLSIEDVIVVACVAAVLGGVLGYGAGRRWGVGLIERPGRGEERRKKTLSRGTALYRRWGWLAVFFLPAFIAGIARMRFVTFVICETMAAVMYQFATALSAYGAAKVISGHVDTESLIELAVGVVLVVVIFWRVVLPRRGRHARPNR